jgi:hypothetical protein
MRTMLSIACLCTVIVAGDAFAQTPAEQRAILRNFERAVAAYVDRFELVECSDVRPTPNQAVIFTMPVSMVFRQLIATALGHPQAPTMSGPYQPPQAPPGMYESFSFAGSSAVPPILAMALPALPPRLEYHFVNHDLVLRDIECNLVVAVLRDAIRFTNTLTQLR